MSRTHFRLRFLVVAAVVALVALTAAAVALAQVTDGGFEICDNYTRVPLNWAGTYLCTTYAAHSGNNSLELTSADGVAYQSVVVSAGTLTVDLWCNEQFNDYENIDVFLSDDACTTALYDADVMCEATYIFNEYDEPVGYDWSNYSTEFSISENATLDLCLSSAGVLVDDVSYTMDAEPTPTETPNAVLAVDFDAAPLLETAGDMASGLMSLVYILGGFALGFLVLGLLFRAFQSRS